METVEGGPGRGEVGGERAWVDVGVGGGGVEALEAVEVGEGGTATTVRGDQMRDWTGRPPTCFWLSERVLSERVVEVLGA